MNKQEKKAVKKWLKKKPRYLKVPVLHDRYSIAFCYGDAEKIKKILWNFHYPKNTEVDALINGNRGLTFYAGLCHPVIAMPVKPDPKNIDHLETIVHECVHAVERLFQQINHPIGDEIYAQSVGATFRQILEGLKKLS